MEYIKWQGQFKNLQYVPDAGPFEILLIDDDERFIQPGHKSQWIPIKMFNPHLAAEDEELLRIRRLLEDRLDRQ
jgi:hypothetical protein